MLWRKVVKNNNSKFDEFIMKADIEHFGCNEKF